MHHDPGHPAQQGRQQERGRGGQQRRLFEGLLHPVQPPAHHPVDQVLGRQVQVLHAGKHTGQVHQRKAKCPGAQQLAGRHGKQQRACRLHRLLRHRTAPKRPHLFFQSLRFGQADESDLPFGFGAPGRLDAHAGQPQQPRQQRPLDLNVLNAIDRNAASPVRQHAAFDEQFARRQRIAKAQIMRQNQRKGEQAVQQQGDQRPLIDRLAPKRRQQQNDEGRQTHQQAHQQRQRVQPAELRGFGRWFGRG